MKNYRRVTLSNTAYKIYASILNDMLVKELEGKLREEQLGFRKGRGTVDAIYILNHIINHIVKRTNNKKEESICIFCRPKNGV